MSIGCSFGSGERAYWLNASTMLFSAATCSTINRVERPSISASLWGSLSASLSCSRSAASCIGVSGFLISCASRRATSLQATARCAVTTYCEGRASTAQTAKAIGNWIYQDLLCRWGAVCEIISDNGTPFVAALEYIAKTYHVYHIRISGYNSQANGIVERPHFHVRDALYKACEGDPSQWVSRVYSVLWADRITVRRRMGCSPYYAVTGTHPIMPLDIAEATYLLPTANKMISTTELITQRAIALQKRPEQIS